MRCTLIRGKSLTTLLFLILLLGLIAYSILSLGHNDFPHSPEKGRTKTYPEENYSIQTPPFPSELKEVFLALLPKEEEIKTEIRRFKETRGYEPEAIVIGIPPAIYTKDEIKELMTNVERLWEKGYQMEVVWNILSDVCPCYVTMLAEEIERYSVPSKIFCIVDKGDEAKALELIGVFESRNISVWIKPSEGRAKFVKAPPSLDEEQLIFLLNSSKAIFEGKDVSGVVTEGYGEGNWVRDRIYHGWICVFNHRFNYKWWFWRACSTGILSGCRDRGPSELAACDIHYMREMYFYGEMGKTNGLINFPGCEPAKNPEKCKGGCGVINTLWMGNCNLSFSKLPLNDEIYFIYASYIPTHTKKDPFPYFSYCGCLGRCPDPQVFIIDIRYVFSP